MFNSDDTFDRFYQEKIDDLDNILFHPRFHPVELQDDFFYSESLYDPISSLYKMPVEVIRHPILSGNYKIHSIGANGPCIWFEYSTINEGRSSEWIIAR